MATIRDEWPEESELRRVEAKFAFKTRSIKAIKRKISSQVLRVSVNCDYNQLLNTIKATTQHSELELHDETLKELRKRLKTESVPYTQSKIKELQVIADEAPEPDKVKFVDEKFFENVPNNVQYINLGTTVIKISDNLLIALERMTQLRGIAYWPREEVKKELSFTNSDESNVQLLQTLSKLHIECLHVR